MMKTNPLPDNLFSPTTRHMVVVAHQDDEVMYSGTLRRLPPNARFLWVTNGDGLAPEVNMDPRAYAEIRKTECDQVLLTLGKSLDARRCLDESEIEIYTNFVELTLNPGRTKEVMDFFHRIGNEIYRELKAHQPDVVWSAAFQNGHPEHDLVHILTAYALRQIERETGRKTLFLEWPEYEYTILICFRFHPLSKGIRYEIRLTDEELDYKERAIACYPSQVKLVGSFQKVIDRIGMAGRLIGKGFTAKDFVSREVYGEVPPDRDYTRSTHWFEWANYMFDKHKNVKVRFNKHLAVIAETLRDRPFV